ncbi:hypothetical protein BLA29_012123, partial [Euroglyphus maynei]
ESPKWELLECKTIKFLVEEQSTATADDADDNGIVVKSPLIQNRKLIHISKMFDNNHPNDGEQYRPITIRHVDNKLILRQPFKILTDIWGVLV